MRTSDLFIAAACACAILGVAGCASPPGAPTSAPSPKPPPPSYNLAGYPPAFKDGFKAGCSAAKQGTSSVTDAARYGSDPQYKAGWKDGQSICKAK